MRLYQVEHPGSKLINTLTLIEPAFWTEMTWSETDVTYIGVDPITYSVPQLKRMSWAFYFNQAGPKPIDSVTKLLNSYNRDDFALWAMIIDDFFLRNPHRHYNRPAATADRVTYDDTPTFPPSSGALNLAHQIPALLKLGARRNSYTVHDVELVQGQQPTAITIQFDDNINAKGLGFDQWSHNGHKGGFDKDISAIITLPDFDLLQALFGPDRIPSLAPYGLDAPSFDTPLPQIWVWFNSLQSKQSYQSGEE
jgi:hypothetical protein